MPKTRREPVVNLARVRELRLQAGRGKPRYLASYLCMDCHGLNDGINRMTGKYCHCRYDRR